MILIGAKSIADYLGRSERTIIRWYNDRMRTGVPIYRVVKHFEASTSDLDNWRRNYTRIYSELEKKDS
jgi:hypothetical protein